ncbi:hypothetical protein E5288_WYG020467 [Bos mutus]|uniref:MAGE domain-containing protein n=1 Tax=Bos mutus TaxID=72004 RepID=A0A6B0SE11_9CETA|nr:hypothetical protein [Bos mutus]
MTLPADLSVALAQPVPVGHRSFRLLLEESAFQALSHCFMSFWWEEDGTCLRINEELFKDILERVGSGKLFETDCLKSFVCQLSLYGFSKACQDVLTSLCLTSLLMEEPPVCVLSKYQAKELVCGVEVKEVDPMEHIYIMVSTLGFTCNAMLSSGQGFPKAGLLVLVLSLIMRNGDRAPVEEV